MGSLLTPDEVTDLLTFALDYEEMGFNHVEVDMEHILKVLVMALAYAQQQESK